MPLPEPAFSHLPVADESTSMLNPRGTTAASTAVGISNSASTATGVTTSTTTRAAPRGRRYRGGFTTSICSLFSSSSSSSRRNDCCAVAFCGILSFDRTKYLLTDERPTASCWWRRLLINLGLPLVLYMAYQAVFRQIATIEMNAVCERAFPDDGTGPNLDYFNATLYPPEEYLPPEDITRLDTLQLVHFSLFLSFIITCAVLLARAANARFHLRNLIISELLERDRQVGRRGGGSSTNTANLIKEWAVVRSATRTCGCYNSPDGLYDDTYAPPLDGSADNRADELNASRPDLCTCLWDLVSTLFCSACCGCWCQCYGICATGQEEREVETLVPKEKLLVDYVTFQPYADYFPLLENLRRSRNGAFRAHWSSMSTLATELMKAMGIVLLILAVYALTNIDSNFTLITVVVVLATLLQSLLLQYFVHWRWHRFDLSLDAVIKYFACGFLFSTSTAFVVEILVSFAVTACTAVLGIFALAFEVEEFAADGDDTDIKDVIPKLIKENIWLGVLFMAANAFVVAAITEELCKYFGFWMVEHPDLLTTEEGGAFMSAMEADSSEEREGDTLFRRDLNSKGVGVTIAMVSTAVGFACCENLSYVFATSDIQTELVTLLARSILPVHPLAAAIQSIGVCRRDLEGDKSLQLGRIILPAVILHGCFDFFLFVAPVFTVLNHADDIFTDDDAAKEEAKYNAYFRACQQYGAVDEQVWKAMEGDEGMLKSDMIINGVTISLSVLSVVVGVIYYIVQSRAQKKRLGDLDRLGTEGNTLLLGNQP